MVFGAHFTWLFLVLARHSSAGSVVSFLLYCLVVGYFSLSSGGWFAVTSWACRMIVRGWYLGCVGQMILVAMLTLLYWSVGINYLVRPLGLPGYPFLNPLIPLASYAWFLRVVTWCMIWVHGGMIPQLPLTSVYCPPVINRVINADALWHNHPEEVGRRLYYALRNSLTTGPTKPLLCLSPESTFAFPLNQYPHLCAQWKHALPEGINFLIGSVLERAGRYYQAVFWLHEGLIIKFYVKKIHVPFIEYTPPLWTFVKTIKSRFLRHTSEFSEQTDGVGEAYFDIARYRIVPRICLEFFFCQRNDIFSLYHPARSLWLCAFVNDSWFDHFFRRNLFLLAQLKAAIIGAPVIYCGHFGCEKIILYGED
jgi:hypothetical protein